MGISPCVLLAAAFMIPHPDKAHSGGEDSYFISKQHSVIGVADGVGGWATIANSDSSFWSREIMRRSEACAALKSPREILLRALFGLESNTQGSTTVSIAALNHTIIESYIVGDSGLAVFRNGTLLRKARDSLESFNRPYQIGSNGLDRARDGALTKTLVRGGDVVVLATDGLWDNLAIDEIGRLLGKWQTEMGEEEFVLDAAERLAEIANQNGADPNYESPFALKVRESGKQFSGGKPDDVTVVVGLVIASAQR
jgi:protein phosphatase PTC7